MFDKKATREILVQKRDKWHTLKVKIFDLFKWPNQNKLLNSPKFIEISKKKKIEVKKV